MLSRLSFRGQYKEDQKETIEKFLKSKESKVKELIDNNILITLSIFEYNCTLYLYYECVENIVNPLEIFDGIEKYMEGFAGELHPRYFVPMIDIFHYNAPVSVEHWRRKEKASPYAMILKLEPEMISSYIFYHYQYQEEKPGDGDKYGIINLHENLMFFYLEEPTFIEASIAPGKLKTNNTPPNWQEIMNDHFLPWEGGELWKKIQRIISI